jgi:hypothetical protein
MSTRKSTPHSHLVTRGSMKLSHNLDDRQERVEIHAEGDSKPVDLTKQVMKRYSNLSWLYTRTSDKQ